MNIKHSKFKNTGILFELLIKQLTSDVMSGNKNSKVTSILERYFNKNKELGKELILYRSVFNSKQLTETKALDYINVLIDQRKKLDVRRLKEEKYNLVKEIKENFDLDRFLSNRIPSYKVYASIYKNFECASQGYTFENVEELSEAKYTIVEFLGGSRDNNSQIIENEILTVLKEQEEDLRLLTYKFVLQRFNKKYEHLNENQKKLLREFLNKGMGDVALLEFVKEESKTLSTVLFDKVANIPNDVQRIKLNEVANQLSKISQISILKNNHMTALMIGYEIDKQLDSFQKNHIL